MQLVCSDCLTWMQAQRKPIADLTLTSPPYEDARTYGIGFKLRGPAWVEWCIPRIVEMCRITNGLVIFNAAGKVRDWKYSPVVEWLVADLTRYHGIVCGPAPYVFSRVGIPGSGSKHYHRRDWEPIYAFCRPEVLPLKWSANVVMGHPPKYGPGGEMSHRLSDGSRRNEWGGVDGTSGASGRRADGSFKTTRKVMTRNRRNSRDAGEYVVPAISNPGNVIKETYTAAEVRGLLDQYESGDIIHCKVGGGVMGSKLCHENEAPFPETLAEFFVRSYCPPGGTVFDPFLGSGTTLAVAAKFLRNGIGVDCRQSQIDLTMRRLAELAG